MTRALGLCAAAMALAGMPGRAAAQRVDTLTLADAIGVALERSTPVLDARAFVSAADGRVREAWAQALPDVNALASYQRNFLIQEAFLPAIIFDPDADPDELIGVKFGAENNWFAGVTLTQPLFQADVFVGIGAAGRFRQLEGERARGAGQGAVTSVRQRYFEVLAAQELMRLNSESVNRVRQTLEETRARYRAGLASEYEVLRFEVQLANLEPGARRARDAAQAAKRALLVAMGRPATDSIEVVGRLREVDILDLSRNTPEHAELIALSGPVLDAMGLDSAYAAALAARTDVRQVELNIALEQARLKVERAQLFPKVSLFGAYNLTAQDPGSPDFFGENANYRTPAAWAGIRIELPVFRGFRESARMQQARAAIEQNQAQLALTREETADQLRTLVAALGETRERVASEGRAVAQAQRGYEIASAEYREGLGSQLQVTDADLALRQSEFNYAQAIYEYLVARSNLDAALGTVPHDGETLAIASGH
jgi:outer membrane protein TolC